jgi:DNA-binding response OmpR family regulator
MSPDQTPARHRVILIVEDDDALRRMYRTALAIHGFTVEEASDAPDALRLLEQSPPDLVVLDLGLPTMSGVGVRQEIGAHALTRDIPVVVVTGSTQDLSTLDVPCVLRKPISPDELIAAVERCLVSRPPHAGS